MALSLEYAEHITAHRLGHSQNDPGVKQNLNPSICSHDFSCFRDSAKQLSHFSEAANLTILALFEFLELLRPEERVNQIH
jgi:hypothetical protein